MRARDFQSSKRDPCYHSSNLRLWQHKRPWYVPLKIRAESRYSNPLSGSDHPLSTQNNTVLQTIFSYLDWLKIKKIKKPFKFPFFFPLPQFVYAFWSPVSAPSAKLSHRFFHFVPCLVVALLSHRVKCNSVMLKRFVSITCCSLIYESISMTGWFLTSGLHILICLKEIMTRDKNDFKARHESVVSMIRFYRFYFFTHFNALLYILLYVPCTSWYIACIHKPFCLSFFSFLFGQHYSLVGETSMCKAGRSSYDSRMRPFRDD